MAVCERRAVWHVAKMLQFCLIFLKDILESLWRIDMHFTKFLSCILMVCFWQSCSSCLSSNKYALAQWPVVRSNTNILWSWNALGFICNICLFILLSVFLLQPHLGRSSTVLSTLNLWIVCATIVKGTSSYMEMVSKHLLLTCQYCFLNSWDNSILSFLGSMFNVVHAIPNSSVTIFYPLNWQTGW